MEKKIIRLTESDLTKIVKRVIEEQSSINNVYRCEPNTPLNICLKKSGFKGTPMFNLKGYSGQYSMLYQVKDGDTWNGILNKTIIHRNQAQENRDYSLMSKNALSDNPQLKGNAMAIKGGDILFFNEPI